MFHVVSILYLLNSCMLVLSVSAYWSAMAVFNLVNKQKLYRKVTIHHSKQVVTV